MQKSKSIDQPGRGGKREGAGRPKAPPTAVIRVRLPIDTYTAVIQLGGDKFVKRVVMQAVEESIEQTKGK